MFWTVVDTPISLADSPARALGGIRVVEFGQYLAGPLAATMLADLGADVIRIERPAGPSWRTPANAMLLRGRRETRVLDLNQSLARHQAVELVEGADVLIENFRPGVMDRFGLGPEQAAARNERLVYCSMPGFGRDDERASWPGWEGIVLAAAGAYADSPNMLDGEWHAAVGGPAFTPLLLASVFAGMQAATGVIAALIARHRDGKGQFVEAALYDSFFEAIGARALRYERDTPSGTLLGSGLYRCADGRYVSLVTVWHRHLEWFLMAAGKASWIADGTASYGRLLRDADADRELRRRLIALFMTRPAAEWEQIGRRAGAPVAAVRSTEQWCAEDQARLSGTIVTVTSPDGRGIGVPGPAIGLSDRGTAAGEGDRSSRAEGALSGLRVLDLTRVLAAPSATRILAELGADVIKADVLPGSGRAGLPEPFFHESANRGKRLMAMDLGQDAGRLRLRKLLAWAQVLVTNFSQRALERLGIDEQSVREMSPDLSYVYLNTFGVAGPWRDLRGYAEIANAVTGVSARTLGSGPPSGVAPNVDLPRMPFTDYAAGVLGAMAALVAHYYRLTTGRRAATWTSLVTAASYCQLPYLADSSGTQALGWSALQRLYRTADGWIFLAVPAGKRDVFCTHAEASDCADDLELQRRCEVRFERLTSAEARMLASRCDGEVADVRSIEQLLAPGGDADRRGLRLAQSSARFGWVVQPGPTLRLSRTPMQPGALPGGWL